MKVLVDFHSCLYFVGNFCVLLKTEEIHEDIIGADNKWLSLFIITTIISSSSNSSNSVV
jgi:hypothetical protein